MSLHYRKSSITCQRRGIRGTVPHNREIDARKWNDGFRTLRPRPKDSLPAEEYGTKGAGKSKKEESDSRLDSGHTRGRFWVLLINQFLFQAYQIPYGSWKRPS
jgi:hypothetical protein